MDTIWRPSREIDEVGEVCEVRRGVLAAESRASWRQSRFLWVDRLAHICIIFQLIKTGATKTVVEVSRIFCKSSSKKKMRIWFLPKVTCWTMATRALFTIAQKCFLWYTFIHNGDSHLAEHEFVMGPSHGMQIYIINNFIIMSLHP